MSETTIAQQIEWFVLAYRLLEEQVPEIGEPERITIALRVTENEMVKLLQEHRESAAIFARVGGKAS